MPEDRPNFFKVTDEKFLISKKQVKSGFSLDEYLFTKQGSSCLVLGSTYMDYLNIDVGSKVLLTTYTGKIAAGDISSNYLIFESCGFLGKFYWFLCWNYFFFLNFFFF